MQLISCKVIGTATGHKSKVNSTDTCEIRIAIREVWLKLSTFGAIIEKLCNFSYK